MAEYLTYPFKIMRITQNYNGSTSHYPHTSGTPKDYPIDEGVKDSGRDPMYAPCDVVIKRIYGVGSSGTNTLWVESTEEVITPAGTGFVTMLITHPNDSDLRKLRVGQVIKKGEIICYEGTDGATGNHIHLSVGLGHMAGSGWTQNSKRKWVLSVTGKTLKPQEAFYVDKNFTSIASSAGISFKPVPKSKFTPGNYKVKAKSIKVREGAGKAYKAKKFNEFTKNAQAQIKAQNKNKAFDGYVKGTAFTATEVKYNSKDKYTWGKTPSGWVALDKCTKI